MNVATNGYWSVDVRHVSAMISAGFLRPWIVRVCIPFFQQNLSSLVANLFHLIIISSCPCVLKAIAGDAPCVMLDTYIRLRYGSTCSELLNVLVQVAHLLFCAPRRCNLSRRLIALRRTVFSRSRGGCAVARRGGVLLNRERRSRFVYIVQSRLERFGKAVDGLSRLSRRETTNRMTK